MTISIANRAQLVAALSTAVGGEVFSLAPGDYGSVSLSGRKFGAAITIQSANASQLAEFDAIDITNSNNVTLKALDVGRAMQAWEGDYGKMVSIWGSNNITMDGMKIHGSLDGNPQNDGWGVVVSDSSHVRITNSEFTELHRGAVFQRSSQLLLEGSNFHNLRSDGANFAQVDTVTIKDNRFSDFYHVAGDHPDGIQFWTSGTTRASANITITGNQIFQGKGGAVQGIFLNDELGHLAYKNVKIDNNLVYSNELWHGIGLIHGDGVSITNNTVVSRTDDFAHMWIMVDGAKGVTIARNVADQVVTRGAGNANIYDNLEIRLDKALQALLQNLNKGAATTVQDLITPNYGYQPGNGTSQLPPPPAPAPANKDIYGTAGNDTVNGTSGNDTIYGVGKHDGKPGIDSVDKLYGRGGADVFVLGDARGVFYSNDKGTSSGRWDYAQIMDFGSDDKVKLSGSASDYVFRRETVGGLVGTAIFEDSNGNGKWDNGDELIGHVAKTNLSMGSLIFSGTTQTSQTIEIASVFDEEIMSVDLVNDVSGVETATWTPVSPWKFATGEHFAIA